MHPGNLITRNMLKKGHIKAHRAFYNAGRHPEKMPKVPTAYNFQHPRAQITSVSPSMACVLRHIHHSTLNPKLQLVLHLHYDMRNKTRLDLTIWNRSDSMGLGVLKKPGTCMSCLRCWKFVVVAARAHSPCVKTSL